MVRLPVIGLFVVVTTTAGCRPPAAVTASSRSLPSAPALTTTERLLADSAARQKGTLELARIKLLATMETWAQPVRDLDEQLVAVDMQLFRLPPMAALAAMDGVLNVLDQREAGLQVELEQLRVQYTDAATPVLRTEEELQQLMFRREELRAQRGLYDEK